MHDTRAAIQQYARELGFDRVGFAQANVLLHDDFARYEQFIASGMHAGMQYLARNQQVRRTLDCDGILPGARTVVCLAKRYALESHRHGELPGLLPHIARYARGRDYHKHVRKDLERLAARVVELVPNAKARPLCDTAPVLERAWAARAGLGFVGKNGLLISPGIGSYVVLGEVVTTVELAPDEPLAGRCGSCTRCLDACPTQAFAKPWVLDARRCISYWTIEHRGELGPEAPRDGKWFFGCDVCQEVCPFNAAREASIGPGTPFDPMPHWSELSLEKAAQLDDEAILKLTEGSPLRRLRPYGFRRNAQAVLAARHRAGSRNERG